MPDHSVRTGDRWLASVSAVRELTDLDRIDEGKVECRLEQVASSEGKSQARVALAGTVRGINEDGPNRQTLEGYFYFDLESNHLSYLYLKGIHSLLDKDGREVGRVEGRFAMTRKVNTTCPELSDEAIKTVALEPDADNTLLLYENPDLGVRFLYPRRWRVSAVRGTQITLDGVDGNGVMLTVDPPARAPGAAQFLTESRSWLVKQQARVVREEPARRVRCRSAARCLCSGNRDERAKTVDGLLHPPPASRRSDLGGPTGAGRSRHGPPRAGEDGPKHHFDSTCRVEVSTAVAQRRAGGRG